MGYPSSIIAYLAPALKARTVLNLYVSGRLNEEEFVHDCQPSTLAHNAHYMQAAKDAGICLWFFCMADKEVAIYNATDDGPHTRVCIGWHDRHVRPLSFRRPPSAGVLVLV
ncbi:hypothetical protein ADUPG1_001692 [Aduncisulcus paluster]|uniref:Uncharacterized protein n=1 Tax=Aduncisulcus paluster TaxID=2918883 RepID=A0ABQ5KE01_9EUKA|nr:hypothetical protein ADUPG1_001692 [Aduncisulcus paluster]